MNGFGRTKRQKKGWQLLLAATLVLGGLLADSGLRLETTEFSLSFDTLPESFDGFRILQLSDIHGAVFGQNNTRLLTAAREACPDLIAITGDLADRDSGLANTETLLRGLTGIAPVYYVSGNHEWSDGLLPALRRMFDRCGIRYLQNESVLLERGGGEIVLAGVEDPNGWADMPTPREVVAALPEDRFRILLAHRNNWVSVYPNLPVDLIFCGHAHGGVIRLPLLGGVLGHGGTWFPDYVSGVYTSGRYLMVVSRGIGNSGGIPRLLNPPELVVVTLKKS